MLLVQTKESKAQDQPDTISRKPFTFSHFQKCEKLTLVLWILLWFFLSQAIFINVHVSLKLRLDCFIKQKKSETTLDVNFNRAFLQVPKPSPCLLTSLFLNSIHHQANTLSAIFPENHHRLYTETQDSWGCFPRLYWDSFLHFCWDSFQIILRLIPPCSTQVWVNRSCWTLLPLLREGLKKITYVLSTFCG